MRIKYLIPNSRPQICLEESQKKSRMYYCLLRLKKGGLWQANVNTGIEYSLGNTGIEYSSGNTGIEYSSGNTGIEYSLGNTGIEYSLGNTGIEYSLGNRSGEN